MNKIYGSAHPTVDWDENFVLANIVFKMRFNHLKEGSDLFKANREKVKEEYSAVINGIAKELIEAQNRKEIRLRPSFSESVEKETFKEPMAIVTTNWDTLLDEYFEGRFPVMHLHGSVLDPRLMLLPSEVVLESYRDRLFGKIVAKMHKRILCLFEHAEKVIIYGLSLDPLDAELNLIVGDSLRNDNSESKTGAKEVVVIDRNHDRVVNRLRHFDPKMNIRVVEV